MRRLILLRHAKSAWDAPSLADHDRPLARRGRLAAPLMGAWLAEEALRPDAALISTSLRTRQTWARLRPALPGAPEPTLVSDLYEATPDEILDTARAAPPAAQTLLLLGHNPGFEELASQLSGRALRMPTAAAAVFESDAEWADLPETGLRLTAFETPKSLV